MVVHASMEGGMFNLGGQGNGVQGLNVKMARSS